MSKLGGLYYEITLKDSTNTGLSAIEKKIKNLSTSISPKITSAGLNGQLKEASKSLNPVNVTANITLNKDSKTNLVNSIKGAVASGKIKVNFEAYVESLRTSIRNAVNGATYKATIDARVRELQTSIRNAINAGDYKAKIAADTTLLAGAIQRQINQQTFTAKVTLTSQSATTDKKKKSEEVTNTKTKKRKDEPIKITVDASSAPKTIQTAIDSKDYKAKVGADTTQLVDAINKAIPQEKTIKINGTVSTNGGGSNTNGGGSKSNGSSGGNTPTKELENRLKNNQALATKVAQSQNASDIKNNAIQFYTDRISEQSKGLGELEAKLKRVNALIEHKGSANDIDKSLVARLEARKKIYEHDIAHLVDSRGKIESKKNWAEDSLRAQMSKSSESYVEAQVKAKNQAEAKTQKDRDTALTEYLSRKAKNAVIGQNVSQNIQKSAARAKVQEARAQAQAAQEEAQALKDQAKNLQEILALRNQTNKAKAKLEAEEAKRTHKRRENDIRAALAEKDRKDKANSQALKAQTASLSDRLNERANLKAQTERQQKLNYYRDRINEYERGVKELQARIARLQSLSFKRGYSSQVTSEAIKRAQSRKELYRTKIAGLSDEMNKISLGKWDGKTDHTNRQIELEKAFANQVAAQEKANRDREKLIEKYKAETAKDYERGLRNAQNIASKRSVSNTSGASAKSDNDAKSAQSAYERQQKAEEKAYANHLKEMQRMRDQYEKDKWKAIRSGKMSAPQTNAASVTLRGNNDTRYIDQLLPRMVGIKETISKYQQEINKLDKANGALVDKIGSGKLGLKGDILNRQLQENLGWIQAYKNEIQSLKRQYSALSQSLNIPQRVSIPQTFVGYGGTPTNHSEMQRKWEEHFAWKDREMKQTTAGNMRMSADDAKKAADAARREAQAAEEAKRAEEAKKLAIKAAAEQRRQAANEARKYATEMQRVASEFQNVGNKGGWLRDQLQNVFSMYGVQQFLQNLIMIGGEFEKQRIALGSIFKNTAKGNELFGQVKQWSVKSPFTFSQLSSYTKQLASFGFQYRDVLDTTKKLADISAGVGVDMGRVILAYGQVFTAKYLRGQELRQFTEAGIPMVDELSKVLTERMHKNVSTGDVFKLISDKQVKFEDVEKVINNITGEGGTFYKMQEKQSESLAGRWTNLKDAVEIMYSNIESANNGWLKGSVALLTKLALAWKEVGVVIGTVAGAYGLLAIKRRIVASITASETGVIASINSKRAALESQTVAYNQLAEAIAKKNYVEGQGVGSNVGYFGKANRYTWRERAAATNMATRLALNGTPTTQITPLYTGATQAKYDENGQVVGFTGKVDKGFRKSVVSAQWLHRRLQNLKMTATGSIFDGKTWALWGTQAQVAMKNVGLSLKSIGLSIASTAASMLPMMAITAAISGIAYLWQKNAEEEQKNNEIIEGTKSSYKELYDFIEANPIEIAIKKGDRDELSGLIEKYEEEARNSPINIDFAITQSKNISDMGERLEFLKQKLQEVAEAEMWLKEHSLGLNKKVEEDADGAFDEGYDKNIKDYLESVKAYNAEITKMDNTDADKFLAKLSEYSHGTEGTEDFRKKAESLRLELLRLKKDGNMQEFWDKAAKNPISAIGRFDEFMRVLRNLRAEVINDKKTKDEDADTAYQDFQKSIEGNSKALFNGGLTDFGHDLLVGWAKNFGEAHDMMDSEVNQMIADLEQRSKPAINSVWQNNTQSMNALVDQIKANCANLFEGSDISNGLSQQQKDAIQQIIRNAPAECKQYTNEWQRLLNENKLTMTIGVRFNMSGLTGNIPSVLQESFDRNVGSGDNNKYGAYRPEKDQDFDSYNQERSSSLNKRKTEIKNLKAVKNKTQAQKDKIKSLEQEQENEEYAFKNTSPFGYAEYEEKNKKKDKKNTGGNSGKNTNKNDDKQRRYENELQKRFQQIKRVREMYEKLRGLYGDVGAMEKIEQSGLIPADLIPKNVTDMETFLKKYQAIMKKFYNSYKANSENLRNLNSQVAQELLNLKFDQEKEALDKAVSTLETQLERAGDAWRRYKDLLSEGMNMPLAKFMVYGDMGNYNMVESDDSGSQRMSLLRERAERHITEKTGVSPSESDMDRYLLMNEDELKTEFGNNEKVTKGLWTIVKTYQEVAKTIRSENDKLISQLYKDSLSYASQIEGIARKHSRERATIKEKQNAYAPAKQRYDRAVQQGVNIEGRLKYQQSLAESSAEYRDWSLSNFAYEAAKDNLLEHDKIVKEGEKPNTNRKELQKNVNDAKAKADKDWNVYIATDAYKGIAPLEEEQKKNVKEQEVAKEKLSDTLPPNVAEALLAQSKINERNEKSDVSQKLIEGSDGYIELFNNIYNLASKTANEIADNLIATLDEKLANGEITQEDYNKVRGEISSHRNEVYEKGTDGKNASLWQVGFGGITKNQIQQSDAAKNTAGAMMESISRQMDDIDADTTMSSADKLGKKGLLQSQYNKAKADYEKADKEGNQAAKKQAKQDMIQGGFGMAANMGQNLTQFRDTLGGTLDAFGIDTENNEGFQKFSTAVDVMSDVSSGMSNAMQSMMSGDFVGAAFSIIETPMNISNAFAKLHDKKLDIQINQSKELQEEVQTAADELKTAIQDSLGSEDAKNRAMSRQGEMAQILADAGVEDTIGAGLVYSMLSGKKSGSDVISENEHKFYGKDGKVTDNEYRHVFNFGKFLENTLALGTSTAIGAIPATGYTTYKAVSNSRSVKRNEEAKAFTRMAEALEKAQFGKADSVSVYGAQYAALLEQRKQAEYQMKLEQDKSNTDEDKVKDYRKQIQELNTQIHEYMTNLAKELYGIDFSSWATKLGDALTNAFRNGEDAAAAFHDTVGDIMADLVKNILITDAIKPMFSKLETTLFGKDGDGSGMLDMNDMEGSIKKAVPYITDFFNQVENSVPGWQQLYDVLDEASGGIVKKTSSSSSSLSGSIKGITEETSTLLASYINAIRLDVSVNRKNIDDLAKVTIPKMSVIAENQLKQLNVIADRATQIEENTRKNSESVEMIRTFLGSVSTTTSGGKAIRFKG